MESTNKMKLTYTNVNGYLIPNLTYKSVNRWSSLANMDSYAEIIWRTIEIQPYQVMLLQDTIGEHLLEVDKAAREWVEVILKQLKKKNHCQIKKQIKWYG